jgi:hypothetical protein
MRNRCARAAQELRKSCKITVELLRDHFIAVQTMHNRCADDAQSPRDHCVSGGFQLSRSNSTGTKTSFIFIQTFKKKITEACITVISKRKHESFLIATEQLSNTHHYSNEGLEISAHHTTIRGGW